MITNRTTEGGVQTTVVSYAYNSVDELVRELSVSSVTSLWEYSYDLAGNRTNWIAGGVTNVSTFASGNQMTGWGSGSLIAYDSAGNMTQIVNRAGVTNSLVWNARYQLIEVRTNGAIAESYGYDALGRRAWISDGSTTNYLVYDGLHVIAEVGPSGSLGRSYTWGPGVDNLLSFTDYTGGETNTYYAIKDHLGSVTAITDTDGAIVESYTFDAFGNVLGVYDSSNNLINESQISNRYLHQGRWYSWETGYYYHRARWRNPETGTWLSKDPIGISGGLNQYVFCGNNPVNFVDPDGLSVLTINPGDSAWTRFRKQAFFVVLGSWGETGEALSNGSAATADGIIPFFDPFEDYYADECGNVDSIYKTSRHLGAISRDLLIASAIPNIGTWVKNPVLYEIGQTTVSPGTYNAIRGLNAIDKGRFLVNAAKGNYWQAAFGTAWKEVGATVGTGLTPGGYLFGLGVFEKIDYQTRK